MTLFQYALQVCTIAYVSIGIKGHVLLAVNLEEFRELASKYLSDDLADKLSNLVSASAVPTRRDRNAERDRIPNINLNWIADMIRDKLLSPSHTPTKHTTKKITQEDNVKRFSTVKNDEHIPRNSEYDQTSLGPVYTRDEIENLLKYNEEITVDDNTKKTDYSETTLKESDEYAVSKHPDKLKDSIEVIKGNFKPKVNQSDANKKIDYTESKLGEWLYNQIISRKPIKMMNHKEPNTDISDFKDKHERNPQYVYETRYFGPKDKNYRIVYNNENLPALKPNHKDAKEVNIRDYKKDEPVTINTMGVKTKPNYKNKLQVLPIEDKYMGYQTTKDKKLADPKEDDRYGLIKSIHGGDNVINHESFGQDHGEDSREAQPDLFQPAVKDFLLDSVLSNNQQTEEHVTYNKYKLGPKENYIFERNPNDQSIEEHDKYENYEIGGQINNSNNKQGVDILVSKENDIFEKKSKDQSEEEHDKYENFEIGVQTNNSNNNYGVDNQQLEESEAKLIQETKKIFNDENYKDENDQSGHDEQLLLRNKKTNLKKKVKVKSPTYKKKSKGFDNDRIILSDSPDVKKEKSESPSTGPKGKNKISKILSSSDEAFNKDAEKERSKSSSAGSKGQNKISPILKSSDEAFNKDAKKERSESSSAGSKGKNMISKILSSSDESIDKDAKKEQSESLSAGSKGKNKISKILSSSDEGIDKDAEKGKSEFPSVGSKGKNKISKIPSSSDEVIDKDVKKEKSESPSLVSNGKKKRSKILSSSDEVFEKDQLETGHVNNEKENNRHRKEKQKEPIEENDMYEKYELGSQSKKKKDKIKAEHSYESKKPPGSTNKYGYGDSNTSEKNEFGHKEKSVLKSTKRDEAVKNGKSTTKVLTEELKDLYKGVKLGSTEDSSGSVETKDRNRKERKKEKNVNEKDTNNKKVQKEPIEENYMYEKFSLGSETKSSNEKEIKKADANKGYGETVLGKKVKEHNIARNKHKDDLDNNDDLLLKNKLQHLPKVTKKVKEFKNKDAPSGGFADDPQPDFKEVKPESIKAKTERLGESVEVKGKGTKKFTMKGTNIPKREFYKLSSPNYYKDLPRTVDKYDFNEPVPEEDRVRDKEVYLKREPSRVNKKLKLGQYEKVKYGN